MTNRPEDAFFPPAVERLYAKYLDAAMLDHVRVVCAEHARQYASRENPVSHGWLAFQLAVGVGVAPTAASRAGNLLDALQPVIDLTDNLADEELDRARGCSLAARYPGVAREVLWCLPPLMIACVVAALHEAFPAPQFRPHDAATRLIRVLAQMSGAQGASADDPRRVDDLAGHQAELLCLPLWLMPTPPPRGAAIERWAFRYGRLWALHQDVLEASDREAASERFRVGRREALEAWPEFPPFGAGGALSSRALLGPEPP